MDKDLKNNLPSKISSENKSREEVKEGGLAALARKILNEVFRAEKHGEFMESIRESSNRIFAGKGTKEELKNTLSKIEDYKKVISKNYSSDVAAIAHNYFSQIEANLKNASKESFEEKLA